MSADDDHLPAPSVNLLRWRSRRGMLELELALRPFIEYQLDALSPTDRIRYGRLLERDDWDIYDWIQGQGEPDDGELVALVARIQASLADNR
jgi:antitoxin CptB